MTQTYPMLVAALLLAGPAAGAAQNAGAAEPPVVVVRGEGLVRSVPDRAFVRIGAESRAKVPKEAQAANAAAMSAVLSRIAAAGIPADAVRTVAISLQQEFDYTGGRQTPRGYVARNVVEVRVDELARLGDVLDATVASGATTIHGLQFDVKQRSELEREALALAVKDGLARAAAAAGGAGRTVDRVLRIDEIAEGPVRPMPQLARMSADAAVPATPVAEGEIEIRASVSVTAGIK